MFLVDVVPLKRIPRGFPQTLTYFSSCQIKQGVLVMVKIRNTETHAIVIACENAKKRKIEIKKSDFELRPVSKIVLAEPILTKQQIKLAFWVSNYYIEPFSLVIKTIAPKTPLKIPAKNATVDGCFSRTSAEKETLAQKPLLVKTSGNSETISLIKEKIKEFSGEMAHEEQILIIAPEISSGRDLTQALKKYFPDKEILNIGEKPAKNKFWKYYDWIKSGKAKIIVGARSAVFLPFFDLGLVIITGEHSDFYKQWEGHPLYDARDVARKLAEIFSARLILESPSPAIASFQKAKSRIYDFVDLDPDKEKISIKIINMGDEQKKGNYSIFSEYFTDKLKKIIQNKQRAILFMNRKGAANFIVCKICGNIAKCPICQIPLIYYAGGKFISPEKSNRLMCNHCGFASPLPRQCSKCKGSEIKYFGLGAQKIENQLQKIFPEVNIFRLDSDSVKNMKDEKIILNLFSESIPSILVGTRQILSAKKMPDISFIGIVSLDAMLAIPDFKTDEKVFSAVRQLEKICKDLAIQTYNPAHPLLKSFALLNYENFAEKETENRRLLFYPPFSKIIKLKLKSADLERGKSEALIIADQIRQKFKEQISRGEIKMSKPAPAFIFREKGFYNWHIIIKIKNEEGTESLRNDKTMFETGGILAKIIPQNWEINVNPESLI